MKRHYIDLINVNRDLISGYKIRCTNHEELMKNLRFLNQMVQKAANLRSRKFEKLNFSLILFLVGKYKTITINQCRAAIKANNAQSLIKSIKTGNV
jgi:Bardet-Biedl syndrome 2 protein